MPSDAGHRTRVSDKALTLDALLRLRQHARGAGRTVVHCHGCFDIIHPGHLRHLRQAKAQGDILLVSITGDSAMNKGAGRPLVPEELRVEGLAALDCVDWVYVEPAPTAEELLARVRPDVYVKGREYENNADPRFKAERRAVEAGGGRVVFTSGDVVFSSTALIGALEHSLDPYHARLSQLLGAPELEGAALSSLISSFRAKRVLVVGEPIIDTYMICDRPDVASESPVMTLRPVDRREYGGGAAIIASHLAAMGAHPVLLTVLPDSERARSMRSRLENAGVEVVALHTSRAVPEKQRFMVGAQKVMKVDLVEPLMLDAAQQDELVGRALELAPPGADGCIIADYGLGMLSSPLISRLSTHLRPRVRTLAGDVSGRRSSLLAFRQPDLLCPSETEAREALRWFDESLPAVAWSLLSRTQARAAALTMGPDGLILFSQRADAHADAAEPWRSRVTSDHVPALSGHPVDALGCGDALLSAATLALASGGTLTQAGFLGSVAAAAQAQRLGNSAISSTDLRQGVVRIHAAHLTYTPTGRPVEPNVHIPFAAAASA